MSNGKVEMELATLDSNPFALAAAALSGGDQKPILKFIKGDWLVGQDNEELPLGTKLAADMMNAEWGWFRWKDQKPVDRRMVTVSSGQPVPSRDQLGHDDRQLWDIDANGKPRDPWQRTIEIPVREISGEKREFILSGSSKGFEGGCKALFKAFDKGRRANAGKTPVIELRSDKYSHPTYGIVKTPAMPLVGVVQPRGGAEEGEEHDPAP